MPIVQLPSRQKEISFPDDMTNEEITEVIEREFPKNGQDVEYEVNQERSKQVAEGVDVLDPDRPRNAITNLSDEDYVLYKNHLGEKKPMTWGEGGKLALETGGKVLSDIAGGIGALFTGKETAQQKVESLGLGVIAGAADMGALGKKIFTGVNKIPPLEDFYNDVEARNAFIAKHRAIDSDIMDMQSFSEGAVGYAPSKEIAQAGTYLDPSIALAPLTLGGSLGAKGAAIVGKEAAKKGILGAVTGAAKKAALSTGEAFFGAGKVAGKVAGAVADVAGTAGHLILASTPVVGPKILGGLKAVQGAGKVAETMQGAFRAAKHGPSRTGIFESVAADTTMSPAARNIAKVAASFAPAGRVITGTVGGAAKGAVTGSAAGAGLGYLAEGEEGAWAGAGAGAALGGLTGSANGVVDFGKEVFGKSTARTRANAIGDVNHYISQIADDAHKAGMSDLFNAIAEKTSPEQAASMMDAIRLDESTGRRVRVLTPEEQKLNKSPGWSERGANETVYDPSKIKADTVAHETFHSVLDTARFNYLRGEMEGHILGEIDPATGVVKRKGIFNDEQMANEAEQLSAAHEGSNPEQQARFARYAQDIRDNVDPDAYRAARSAVAEEVSATYAGKYGARQRPGRFNPSRAPLWYRSLLDGIHDKFDSTFRTAAYQKGMDLNLDRPQDAFKTKGGKDVRISELDKTLLETFKGGKGEQWTPRTRGKRGASEESIALPTDQAGMRGFVDKNGTMGIYHVEPNGNVRLRTQQEADAAIANDVNSLEKALRGVLPEKVADGSGEAHITRGIGDNGATEFTVEGTLTPEQIQSVLEHPDLAVEARDRLKTVLEQLGDVNRPVMDMHYWPADVNANMRISPRVINPSVRDVVAHRIKLNKKSGILIDTLDVSHVKERLVDAMQRPEFKDVYPDFDTALKDLKGYAMNISDINGKNSADYLGGGELGAKKRDMMYHAMGIRPKQGQAFANTPVLKVGNDVAVIRSRHLNNFTKFEPTGERLSHDANLAYGRMQKNFQPASFVEEPMAKGSVRKNPLGWIITQRPKSSNHRVYSPDGNLVGISNTLNKAADMARKTSHKMSVKDYGIQHRPNNEGPRAFDLAEGDLMPADVYDHPEWYSGMSKKVIRETMGQLNAVRGNPNATLTIYRAGPMGDVNTGDWVSLSREYAQLHADTQDPAGYKVWSAKVKAGDVRWSMDDLAEFGYFGETMDAK